MVAAQPRSFLQERLHGRGRVRSAEMLRPTAAGGVRVYGPALAYAPKGHH